MVSPFFFLYMSLLRIFCTILFLMQLNLVSIFVATYYTCSLATVSTVLDPSAGYVPTYSRQLVQLILSLPQPHVGNALVALLIVCVTRIKLGVFMCIYCNLSELRENCCLVA